jgi:dihydrolipoamide dehydrogenase
MKYGWQLCCVQNFTPLPHAEAVLGIEMGSDMQDIGLTIHPHPTLSETLCFAAEMAEGTITDLLPPKKR